MRAFVFFFLMAGSLLGQEYIQVDNVSFIQNGKRFYSIGVNCVNIKDGEPKVVGDQIYDMSSWGEEVWSGLVKNYFDQMGFNTVGPFSSACLQKDLKYSISIYFGNYNTGISHLLLDVFDPSYDIILDKVAKEQCENRKNDKNLIGYFISNEICWYGSLPWIPHNNSLLEQFEKLPKGSPGNLKVNEFLTKIIYRNLPYYKVCDIWAGIVAAEYMRKCTQAIKKYDSNHLILGTRFAALPADEIVRAVAQYSDVVSFNFYNNDFSMLDHYYNIIKKPIMVTEFSWRAMENMSNNPNIYGPWVTVATQKDRANNYKDYLYKIINRPFIIGIQFFQWSDQAKGGRNKIDEHSEDSNYGIFSTSGVLYLELAAAMSEMNKLWQNQLK